MWVSIVNCDTSRITIIIVYVDKEWKNEKTQKKKTCMETVQIKINK